MNTRVRKGLSLAAAITLLVTCLVSGLALPASATDGNLLTNGDFESGATGWGTSSGSKDGATWTVAVAEGSGKDGSYGLKVENTMAEGATKDLWEGSCYKGQFNGMLEANTTYVFSFDYKTEGLGSAKLDVIQKGTDWTGWDDVNLPSATEWTHKEMEFTTGAAENMNANKGWEWSAAHVQYRNQTGTGAAYYDNFKLVKKVVPVATAIALDKTTVTLTAGNTTTLIVTATPAGVTVPAVVWTSTKPNVATVENGVVTAVAAGTTEITATAAGLTPVTCTVTVNAKVDDGNLLTNGDFESGATGWGTSSGSKDGATWTVAVAEGSGKDGSYGLKVENTMVEGATKDLWEGSCYKGQFNGMLEANTTYVFSFDYKTEGLGSAKLDVIQKGTDWTGWDDMSLPSATEWTHKEMEFTTGAAENMNANKGWEWSAAHVQYHDQTGTGAACFDNFKLVKKPKAESIAIVPSTVELVPNGSKKLTIQTTPENTSIGSLVWSSNAPTVVAVDQSGVVTAVADSGSAIITATADGLTPATCTVTVNATANLLTNGDFEAGATGWGLDKEATVAEGNGKDGSKGVKIETTVAEGGNAVWPGCVFKGDFNTLLEPNTTYSFSFDYKTEGLGSGRFSVFNKGSDWTGWAQTSLSAATEWTTKTMVFTTGAAENMTSNKGWEWSVEHVQYADQIGTGAVYYDNFKLVKMPKAEAIAIAPSTVDLVPGAVETAQLTVTTTPANSSTGKLTWTSSDSAVVAVDQSGVVTAIADSGSVTITATSAAGLSATCQVTINEYGNMLVNGDFESGGLNWSPADFIKEGIGKDGSWGYELINEVQGKQDGSFYKANFVLKPATTYEISFDYLATPNASFRLWGDGIGLKSPKVEKGDGTEWKHTSCVFTTPIALKQQKGWDMSIVSDYEGDTPAVIDNICLRLYSSGVPAESVSMNLSDLTLIPGRTGSLALVATPGTADLNGTVWTSSNEDVATVEYGLVTGVGKGTATVMATTANGLSSTCTVTVSGDPALIKDGTFDGGSSAWTLSGGATLAGAIGVQNSKAAALTQNATVTQSFTGLKPNTEYQMIYRFRSTNAAASMTLTNGSATLLTDKTTTTNGWEKKTLEFTTPESLDETTVVTFTTKQDGVVYIDNVLIAEKASLVDFTVESLVWDGGGYQVTPNTELSFAVLVKNQGEDPVEAGSTFIVELSKNREVFQTLTYTCGKVLASDETVLIMSDTPWKAEEGAWVISARVNPDLAVLEMDTTNNTTQTQLRVSNTILEAPEVAQKAGMTDLTFSDEFDSLDSIDTGATGREGYKWYVTRPWGASTLTTDDYSVENGVLTLKTKESTYGIGLTSIDVTTQVGYSFNKGYLEVRLRIPNPTVTDTKTYGNPTVWSLPLGKMYETPGDRLEWVEVDWLEYWGITSQYPEGYGTFTVHHQRKDPETEEEVFWAQNTNNTYKTGLGDCEWHTIGYLWDYNIIQGYVDGELFATLTYDKDGLSNPIAKVNNGAYEDGIFSVLNDYFQCLMLGGGWGNPAEFDYVRIWQGEGGGITLPDDEDDKDEVTMDMEPEQFWFNFCTDDYGDPITEVTYDNYLNILSGEEVWNQLSEARRAEINEYLQSLGQPTFDELLLGAKAMKDKVDAGWTPDDGEEDNGTANLPTDDKEEPGDSKSDAAGDNKNEEADNSEPTPEEPAKTGKTTVLPAVLATVMLLCGAFMVTDGKRKRKN